MKKYIYIISLLLLTSCTDFLDKNPSKNSQIDITTAEQLDALLGNYTAFNNENNMASYLGTDDSGFDGQLYKAESGIFLHSHVFHSTWDVEGVANDPFERNWTTEYLKIFYANLVLDNLSKVSGDENLKESLRREAHFIRAVSYYQLVNMYTMLDVPNNQKELGIVIKRTTSFEEKIPRATLEESYKQIESDLNEALADNSSIESNGKFRPWRISKTGVKAFAARYYLQKGKYEQALSYAQQVLSEYSTLVDYNTEFRYDSKQLIVKTSQGEKRLDMPYTWIASEADIINWKEFLYVRTLYNGSGWFIPSDELMNLYDRNYDLRFRYHYVEDYSFFRSAKQVSKPGYVFFGMFNIPSGPTVAEMFLIKAECLVRKGQWAEGMQAMEMLRVKRIETKGYRPLVVSNASEALKEVLNERRREMPFSMRWFDARRYNQNSDNTDDVEFTRMFYPYSISSVDYSKPLQQFKLPKDSRRWANPIPRTEIISSKDVLKQNTY